MSISVLYIIIALYWVVLCRRFLYLIYIITYIKYIGCCIIFTFFKIETNFLPSYSTLKFLDPEHWTRLQSKIQRQTLRQTPGKSKPNTARERKVIRLALADSYKMALIHEAPAREQEEEIV